MDPSYFWNMFNLRSRKIAVFYLVFFGACFMSARVFSQGYTQLNLPNSDERWIHYGFSIGLHSTGFKLDYSDRFVSPEFDSVHSIMPRYTFGFSLGLIADLRLHNQFNLRVLPRVSFSEYSVDFNYIPADSMSRTFLKEDIETVFVDFPVMIKYKSERHKNFRMYMVGGLAPGIEASGKKRKERSGSTLTIAEFNLSLELGFGVDMYYPYFKFSPEIRYSRGLVNVLREDQAGFSDGISRLSTHTISLYFQFSD